MPPSKKSRKLSRKELQQLKEYGELDPLNITSGGNDLDELISKAMSKNGSHKVAEITFTKGGKQRRERAERPKKQPRVAIAKPQKPTRPDAYTKLLKSLSATSNVPAKRSAIVSDEEEEEEEDQADADTYKVAGGNENEDDPRDGSDPDGEVAEDAANSDEGRNEGAESENDEDSEQDEDENEEEEEEEGNEVVEVYEMHDYMAGHFADDDSPLMHKKVAAVTQKEYKQVAIDGPILCQTVLFDIANQGIIPPNPKPLKQRLIKPFHKLNKSDKFTDFQGRLFNWLDQYRDVVYAGRTFEMEEEITTTYALHAVNHILKSKDRERKNNARLAKAHASGRDVGEVRDRGFTRPKVLVILPFRNSAYRFIHKLLKLIGAEQEMNKSRLEKEFGYDAEEDKNANKRKPEDYQHTFAGNIDDAFRIGLQLRHKSAKLYSPFYASDIIVASPIGLRMTTGAESGERRDFDFLSSIEVVIVDQCDTLLMQNWDHVTHVFDHLNRIPKKDHGCDFSRVRNWYLDGTAQYRRQTIMISEYMTPEIQAVFNGYCRSIEGKVRIKPVYQGAVADVVAQVPQIFKRLTAKRLLTAADDVFLHFTENVLPELEKSALNNKHTLVFVSSYFDFVRVRNHCKEQGLSFAAISEYSTRSEAMRARMNFYEGKLHFILYSERAHFFHRYPIKGIHHMVFYSLPEHPLFYSELVNLMLTSNDESASSELLSCTAFFTKYDQLKVERVVGSKLVPQLISGERSQYTFA
ncbi:rRNA-binding ribosome biosynthesis protein utp25 [Dipsacomyces acuminosporus]|nr:rRNA-binding ribosome biosynthesis protein utp25 [Dipsacomyces acuminosporus]